jgi:hypothetical protein
MGNSIRRTFCLSTLAVISGSKSKRSQLNGHLFENIGSENFVASFHVSQSGVDIERWLLG